MKLSLSCLPALLLVAGLSAAERSPSPRRVGEPAAGLRQVPLAALLAENRLDGKTVSVEGAFVFEFEYQALCLTKEHLENYVTSNCLYVYLDWEALGDDTEAAGSVLDAWKGRYVSIQGVYRRDPLRPLGDWAGSIKARCISLMG